MSPQNPVPSQRVDDATVSAMMQGGTSLASMATSRSLRSPEVEVTASGRKVDPEDVAASDDRDLLEEAWENFQLVSEHEAPWRRKALEQLNFVDNLDHWSAEMLAERTGKPCLVFDRIGPSIDQVVNNMRQNPPEPRVLPVGQGATKEESEIIQGLLRNVDQDNNAEIAYMTAYEHAVKIGRGWWREYFDWEDGESFLQKLIVKRIFNPFAVYPDPASMEHEYSDMEFCFVTDDMSPRKFKADHPNARFTAPNAEFTSMGDSNKLLWFPKGGIRVAEYWRVRYEEERIFMLANGKTVKAGNIPSDVRVVGERTVRRRVVTGAKITGAEVLKRWDWKGKWIPFVAVIGREKLKDSKRVFGGMIGPAMDPNLAYDYMASKEAESIALAPIAPWIAEEGQIEGYEDQYADAHRKAYSVLKYKARTEDGQLLPPPQREVAEPPIAAITAALAHRDADIKNALNTWAPNLGENLGQQSGKAILAIRNAGDNAHANYSGNLQRSMRHAAKIRLDLIPYVYSEERLITILDPDGQVRAVKINAEKLEAGMEHLFRLGEDYDPARYDVTIGTGPSYASRRQQGADALLQLTQGALGPILAQRAPDKIVQALDIPDGDEIADRLRPPDVQGDADKLEPQQLQNIVQQQAQLLKHLSEQVTKLSDERELKIRLKAMELESAERQTTQTNITGVLKTEISAKSSEARTLAVADHDAVKHQLDARAAILHQDRSVEDEAAAGGEAPANTPRGNGAVPATAAAMAGQADQGGPQSPPAPTSPGIPDAGAPPPAPGGTA